MTLRSPICSKPLALVLLPCALWGATVAGSVELRESHIESVSKGKDYSGVVISLRPVGEPPATAPGKHATMLQKNKMFTPHILPIVAGTTIDFPNEDPIYHNAFSSYSGQVF